MAIVTPHAVLEVAHSTASIAVCTAAEVRPNVVCRIGLGVPDMAMKVLPCFDAIVISPGTKPED